MAEPRRPRQKSEPAVAAYKDVLKRVLDNRPSGMRQKLAWAIGKNRSFISQISNPAYPVPIPVHHLDCIFEICHFSATERRAFLDAYARAHPRRFSHYGESGGTWTLSLSLPDLGDPRKNRQLEALIRDIAQRVAGLLAEQDDDPPERTK